jgi:DnaK suppressor protein
LSEGKGKTTKDKEERFFQPEDLSYFKKLIEDKISVAEKNLAYLEEIAQQDAKEFTGDNSTYSFHMADQGTDTQEREKIFLQIQRERKFLQNLHRALERIQNGTYGYCRDTGKPIRFARLEAVPHATLSIEAKKKRESIA